MTSHDQNGQGPLDTPPADRPPREPMLRAPWPALSLSIAYLVCYGLQIIGGSDAMVAMFGFSPAYLERGRVWGLVTALFIHGGWAHAFLNSLGSLAFGAPIARLFGKGAAGATAFFVFFLLCGALSSLGYAAVHWGQSYMLVGASGAVSGFMGAASRLMGPGPGLAPFTSRPVVTMAGAWIFVNLLVAMVGLGAVTGGAPIAWEAHLFGYAAGLLLLKPFLSVLWGRR